MDLLDCGASCGPTGFSLPKGAVTKWGSPCLDPTLRVIHPALAGHQRACPPSIAEVTRAVWLGGDRGKACWAEPLAKVLHLCT